MSFVFASFEPPSLALLCQVEKEKQGSLLVQTKESTLYFIGPTIYIKSCQFKTNVPIGRMCLCEPVHAVVCLRSQSLLSAVVSCFSIHYST